MGDAVFPFCLALFERPEGTSGDSEGREGERNPIGAAGAETLENMRNSANSPKKKAEGVGFEPTLGTSPSPVFKTGAINRSVIPPKRLF